MNLRPWGSDGQFESDYADEDIEFGYEHEDEVMKTTTMPLPSAGGTKLQSYARCFTCCVCSGLFLTNENGYTEKTHNIE